MQHHDPVAASVLQFLHSHDALCRVQSSPRAPALPRDLIAWELHHGLALPEDLKAFLTLADGFDVRYAVRLNNHSADGVRPLGHMHVNSVSELKRLQFTRFRIRKAHYVRDEDEEEDSSGDEDRSSSDSNSSGDDDDHNGGSDEDEEALSSLAATPQPPPLPASSFPQAFDLDSSCPAGHVVLLYRQRRRHHRRRRDLHAAADAETATLPPPTPAIYFVDLSGSCHLLARSFRSYWRQLLLHVGVPYWQQAFTDVGMPPETQQWFRFLSPKRLDVHLAAKAAGGAAATKRPASAKQRANRGGNAESKPQLLQQQQQEQHLQLQQPSSAGVGVASGARVSSTSGARPRSAAVQPRTTLVQRSSASAQRVVVRTVQLSAAPNSSSISRRAAAEPSMLDSATSQLGGMSLRGPAAAVAAGVANSVFSSVLVVLGQQLSITTFLAVRG